MKRVLEIMARILVIEHDLNLLNLISSVLRQDGHTVTETSDPTEALAIAERQPKDFDLILTDVELHPISGFEFVRRLTIKGIHIPTQFMSELPGIAHVIASTIGAHAVIEKPFAAPTLRKGVAKFLADCNRRSSATRESGTGIKAA
jgi:CheY-like chemotaxis protein